MTDVQPTPQDAPILEGIVDRLTMLIEALERAADANAPVSPNFIKEVMEIRDALR